MKIEIHGPTNESLLKRLNDRDITAVKKAFVMVINRNSNGLIGDRQKTSQVLADVLLRLGKRATADMLDVYAKHVGADNVPPEIRAMLDQKQESISKVAPPMVLKPTGKKARKAAAASTMLTAKKPKKPKRPSVKLGDLKANELLQACCHGEVIDTHPPTAIAAE